MQMLALLAIAFALMLGRAGLEYYLVKRRAERDLKRTYAHFRGTTK